jgi:TPR repeat protein
MTSLRYIHILALVAMALSACSRSQPAPSQPARADPWDAGPSADVAAPSASASSLRPAATAAPSASASALAPALKAHLRHDIQPIQTYHDCEGVDEAGFMEGNGHACFLYAYCNDSSRDGRSARWKPVVSVVELDCKVHDRIACTDLGYMYDQGLGVVQDRARAAEFFDKGCKGKDGRGCTWLGYLVAEGAAPKSYGLPKSLFKKGCDLEDGAGCYELADLTDDPEEAWRYVAGACQLAGIGCKRLVDDLRLRAP